MFLAIVLGIGMLCFIILGSAAFFLAKGFARVFSGVARRLLGYEPSATALRAAAGACTLLVFVVVPMKACSHLQVDMYRQAIPPQFELQAVVLHDEVWGIREGCGFAVFRLSDENLARIHRQGLAYFETARLGRDGKPYHQYQPWKATPAAEDEPLFRDHGCAGEPPAWLEQAQRAASQEGAFFTTGHEQDLVVVPAMGLIIYSYNG